jgi:hypothetical protein
MVKKAFLDATPLAVAHAPVRACFPRVHYTSEVRTETLSIDNSKSNVDPSSRDTPKDECIFDSFRCRSSVSGKCFFDALPRERTIDIQ